MNMKLAQAILFSGMAAGAVAMQALPANAFTGYTDRSAWETDIGSFATEEFTTPIPEQFIPGADFDGFSVVGLGDNNTVNVNTDGFFRVRVTDEGLEFMFEQAIRGFFADWGTRSGNDRLSPQARLVGDFDGTGEQEINLWAQLPPQNNPNRPRAGSFGIIGDASFTSFILKRDQSTNVDNISIDNFSYEAVPEPATALALLSIGAIATGGAIKRKQQTA